MPDTARFWIDGIEVGGSLDPQSRATLGPEASELFAKARAENRKAVVLIEYEPMQ